MGQKRKRKSTQKKKDDSDDDFVPVETFESALSKPLKKVRALPCLGIDFTENELLFLHDFSPSIFDSKHSFPQRLEQSVNQKTPIFNLRCPRMIPSKKLQADSYFRGGKKYFKGRTFRG